MSTQIDPQQQAPAKAKAEFRLMMSPLTRTMYAGPVKHRGGGHFESSGKRHDVTSDFIACLIQFAESHGGEFVIRSGGRVEYTVSVRKAPEASA